MSDESAVSVESTALIIHHLQYHGTEKLSLVVHDVRHDSPNGPRLGAGRPLSEKAKGEIIQVLSDNYGSNTGGFIGPYTLVNDTHRMVWYRPRGRTTITLGSNEVTIALPSLVFMVERGHLYVAAYKGDRRPTPDTELLNSGLPNLNEAGHWCTGGNTLPERPHQRQIERIEDMFLTSPFTHMNGDTLDIDDLVDDPESPINGGMTFLATLEGERRFPMRRLRPMGRTLGSWIENPVSGRW